MEDINTVLANASDVARRAKDHAEDQAILAEHWLKGRKVGDRGIMRAGGQNDAGWFKMRKRLGFNINLCNCEEVVNSTDAKSPKILYKLITIEGVRYIARVDIGEGMGLIKLKGFFDCGKLRNRDMHVSGLTGGGGLTANYLNTILASENISSKIITKCAGESTLSASCPWGKMEEEGKFTGEIEISESCESDVNIFSENISKLGGNTGSLFIYPYSDKLWKSIQSQFAGKDSNIKFNEKFSVILGRHSTEILIEDSPGVVRKLSKFNPLRGHNYIHDPEYFPVEVYHDIVHPDELVYVVDFRGKKMFINKTTHTYKKEPNYFIGNPTQYVKVNNHISQLVVYQFDNPERFNTNTALTMTGDVKYYSEITNHFDMHPKSDLKETNEEFLNAMVVIRNGQLIGIKNYIKTGSARGGPRIRDRFTFTRIELHVNIETGIADRAHPIDNELGVQVNKNQLSKECTNPRFTRLVDWVKKEVHKGIWDKKKQIINLNKAKNQIKELLSKNPETFNKDTICDHITECKDLLEDIVVDELWSDEDLCNSPKISLEQYINTLETYSKEIDSVQDTDSESSEIVLISESGESEGEEEEEENEEEDVEEEEEDVEEEEEDVEEVEELDLDDIKDEVVTELFLKKIASLTTIAQRIEFLKFYNEPQNLTQFKFIFTN